MAVELEETQSGHQGHHFSEEETEAGAWQWQSWAQK